MIKLYKLYALLPLLFISGCTTYKPMKVAKNINTTKYMGKWYEIARLPNNFQQGCSCSMANYTLLNDSYISLVNQCCKNSEIKTAQGKAWTVDHKENSKLKVSFLWPFAFNYWILYVSENYEYVVVGEPLRKYLWFLSRSKNICTTKLDFMKKIAVSNGYDLSRLIIADNTKC